MDIRHYYVEQGEGYPLILLHGNGEDHTCFAEQMKAFSSNYHVYAIDTRGHGKTPRGEKPFTIRQFADDLAGFMDEHGIRRAHILGFSDGGNIAMIFAMKYPKKVNRLILDGANLDGRGVRRCVQMQIVLVYRMASFLGRWFKKAKDKAEMFGLMVNDPNVRPEELHMIRAKTLVMAGTKDLILKTETETIAHHIKRSHLRFIKGGHWIAGENPKAFNKTVLSFLQSGKKKKEGGYEKEAR